MDIVDFSTYLEKINVKVVVWRHFPVNLLELCWEIDHIHLKVLYIVFRELSIGIGGFIDFEFSSNFQA